MKKIVYICVTLGMMLAFSSVVVPIAHAGGPWTNGGRRVTSVRATGDGNVYAEFDDGLSCFGSSTPRILTSASDDAKSRMISLLTAALLAGKEVALHIIYTDHCYIDWVQLED